MAQLHGTSTQFYPCVDYLSNNNQHDHELAYVDENSHQLPSYSEVPSYGSYSQSNDSKNNNVDDKIMSVLSAYASSSKPAQENQPSNPISSSSDLDFLGHSQSNENISSSNASSYPPNIQNQSNYAQPTSNVPSSSFAPQSSYPQQAEYHPQSPQQRVSSPSVQYQQPTNQPQQPQSQQLVQSQQPVHVQQPIQHQLARPQVQVQPPAHPQAPLTSQFQQMQIEHRPISHPVHTTTQQSIQQPVQTQTPTQAPNPLHQYAQNQQNQQNQQLSLQQQQLLQHAQLAQAYFDKIVRFMENIDRRLQSLEGMTHNIIRAQQEGSQMPISASELNNARRAQEQLESDKRQLEADMEAARKLQESFDTEYYSNRPPTSTSTQSRPATSTGNASQLQECPICNTRMTLTELQSHIEPCLEKESKSDGPKKVDAADKKGFMERLFGRNPPPQNAAPTKAATPVPPKTFTTPIDNKNAYSAYQQTQYATPGMPPRGNPPMPYMMVNPTTGQMVMPYPYYPPPTGYGGPQYGANK